ncbi:MAG: apolipoprotein N-acyltransferase [Rhizobiaceae bacterium]
MKNLQTHIVERVIVLEGWRASLLAIAAGALSALALAPFHFLPILLVTFPILVWLLDGAVAPAGKANVIRRFWPSFRTGWMFGFGYFLAGFWWVGKAFLVDADEFIYLLPLAVIALPAGLALFWGGATALARLAWHNNDKGRSWVRLMALACCFALFEWLRGTVLTGLPWNNIAYGAMPSPLLMQSSGLVGLYGMTFFTVFVAASFGVSLVENRKFILLPILLSVAHVGYGFFVLSKATDDTVEGVNLRIVQPAIDQSKKWDPAYEAEMMGRYLNLSNTNKGPEAASIEAFSHVIWPESAFPFILTQRQDQLAAIAKLLPPTTTLITGAMRLEKAVSPGKEHKVFNALYVINGAGEIIEARDKTRLLPFGEFLPFQKTLEKMGFLQLTKQKGGFTQGTRRQVVNMKTAPPFLPLICYEIVFSGAVRSQNSTGEVPQWIINITNDAWFGMTAGPYQHAHQAQVRAVEEGLPVVRAANSGISMVVDAYGRIKESLALGEQGVVDAALPVAGPATPFSRYGNMPILIFVCFLFLILVGVSLTNTKKL